MKHCINKTHPDFKKLESETGLNDKLLAAKIAVWQSNNKTKEYPKAEDIVKLPDSKLIQDRLNKIDEVNIKIIKPPQGVLEDENYYTYNNEKLKRATVIATKLKEKTFRYLKGKSDISPESKEKSKVGSEFHNDIEWHINDILGKKQTSKLVSPGYIQSKIRELAQSILDAFPEGTEFRTEVSVINLKKKYAATIDLLAILPDGSAVNVDYKTFYKAELNSGGNIISERIARESEFTYKEQQRLIEEALKETYGFTKVSSVNVPVYGRTVKTEDGVKLKSIRFAKITSFQPENPLLHNISDESILRLISSKSYDRVNAEQKEIIEAIDKRIQTLKKIKPSKGIDRTKDLIQRLEGAKDSIIFNNDYTELIYAIYAELKLFHERFNTVQIKYSDLTLDQIDRLSSTINDVIDVSGFYTSLAIDNKTNDKELQKVIDEIKIKNADLLNILDRTKKSIIKELAQRAHIDNVLSPQRNIGDGSLLMRTLGEIDHSFFQIFNSLTLSRRHIIDKEFTEFEEENKKVTKAYIEYARKKGKGPSNYFDLLRVNGKIIRKYDWVKFKEDWETAIKTDDKIWLKENLILKPDAIKIYKETYEDRKDALKRKFTRSEEYLNKLIAELDSRNPELESSRKDINSYSFNPSDKYFTSEYSNLEKAGKDFIDFYIKITLFSQRVLGLPYDGTADWYVENTFIDNLFQNGMANPITGMKKYMTNDVYEPIPVDRKTTISGREIYEMPRRFISPKEGVVDYSNDLSKVLSIVYYQAIRNKYYSEIEHISALLIDEIATQKVIKRDVWGKSTNVDQGVKPEPGIQAALADFVNYYVYDVRTTGIFNPVVEQSIKRISKIMSANIVGLSLLTNIVNIIGVGTNLFIEGASGKTITRKSIIAASKDIVTNDTAKMAITFLNIKDETLRERVNKLSTQGKAGSISIKNILSLNTAFAGMHYPEEVSNKIVSVAFMRDNTIINNKFVRLNENLKKTNKSILEMFSVKDDNLVMDNILTDNDGYMLWKIKGAVAFLTSNVTGSIAGKDVRRIGMTLPGSQFMMFKNWIPRMYYSRFGEFKEEPAIDAFSVGRYRTFIDGIFKHSHKYEKLKEDVFTQSYKYLTGEESEQTTYAHVLKMITYGLVNLSRSYFDWVTFNKLGKGAVLKESFKKGYAKFLVDHPEYEGRITEEQYVDLRLAGMNANFTEMSILFALAAILIGAGGDDDDKRRGRKVTFLNRLSAELTFFINPESYKTIYRGDLFPIMGFVARAKDAISDIYEYATLEEGKKYRGDPFLRTKKLIFPLGTYYSVEYWLNPEYYDSMVFRIQPDKKKNVKRKVIGFNKTK